MQQAERWATEGKTTVFVATNDSVVGLIALADAIRPESYDACDQLKALGIRLAIITGDNQHVANAVGKALKIEMVFAQKLPDQKADEVMRLRQEGYCVAMIGDGINDAPALAAADVGMAIGAGTDIAIETADIVLIKNDPRSVIDVIKLSRVMRKKMIQNLVWATAYNIIALPMAAGAFYQYGLTMSPAVGAAAMSLSTIIVAINARLIVYK